MDGKAKAGWSVLGAGVALVIAAVLCEPASAQTAGPSSSGSSSSAT